MKKTIIIPIVSVICLAVTAATGVDVDKGTQADIAQGISIIVTASISVYGIIKNWRKTHPKKGLK